MFQVALPNYMLLISIYTISIITSILLAHFLNIVNRSISAFFDDCKERLSAVSDANARSLSDNRRVS
jgi:hypothetical protein